MANVPDADVLLFGSVFKVDQKTNRESGETKHVVTVFAGDGVLLVNIKENDYKWVEIPERGDTIAWYVRSAPYNVDGNSGMSSRFLRRVVPADLEAIAHALQGKQAPKAA